jgi:hypothetical protein
MTKVSRLSILFGLFLAAAVGYADVVVLKGGVVINLKKPPVLRGETVLLTRTDGTLLSVPASEIDRDATTAARAAATPAPAPTPPPAATLAGAARATKEVPKARVKITDADVSHREIAQASASEPGEAEKQADSSAGAGRVEVADYTQSKSGDALIVRGTLRNPGATPAINVRMSVTALDPKGQTIASGEAGISNGTIEPSGSVAFSVTIPVGARPAASFRFAPRWISPSPAPAVSPAPDQATSREGATASSSSSAAPTAPPRAGTPPPPAPTPYGRGSLYAPPAPNAPIEAPKDGKTGYLPGPSHPSNQPKPPK